MVVQILLASGEDNLVLLEVMGGQLSQAGHTKLGADVACLDISPLGATAERSPLAVVGTWDNVVHVLETLGLSPLNSQGLGGDVIPRSLLLASFEGISFLLVALGEILMLH